MIGQSTNPVLVGSMFESRWLSEPNLALRCVCRAYPESARRESSSDRRGKSRSYGLDLVFPFELRPRLLRGAFLEVALIFWLTKNYSLQGHLLKTCSCVVL